MVNHSISFDVSGSFDPDGSPLSYTWDFGDSSPPGSGVTTTHVYAKDGIFTVALTVADNDGANTNYQHTVNVKKNNPPVFSTQVPGN